MINWISLLYHIFNGMEKKINHSYLSPFTVLNISIITHVKKGYYSINNIDLYVPISLIYWIIITNYGRYYFLHLFLFILSMIKSYLHQLLSNPFRIIWDCLSFSLSIPLCWVFLYLLVFYIFIELINLNQIIPPPWFDLFGVLTHLNFTL